MRHRWMRTRSLPVLAISILLLSVRPGARGAAAQPEERDPSSELILLFSGAIQGNMEPCG